MSQDSVAPNDNLISAQKIPGRAQACEDLDEMFDLIAAGMYSMASMLVGEGEDSIRLVETAVANAAVSATHNTAEARQANRRALCAAALETIVRRDPSSLAAPKGLQRVATCIDDDDLDAAGVSSDELERMIAGPDRDRVRNWLEGLGTVPRTIFVLRAVAGLSPSETAEMLKAHGGPGASGWNPDAVRELFRQALCSLASHLLQEASR